MGAIARFLDGPHRGETRALPKRVGIVEFSESLWEALMESTKDWPNGTRALTHKDALTAAVNRARADIEYENQMRILNERHIEWLKEREDHAAHQYEAAHAHRTAGRRHNSLGGVLLGNSGPFHRLLPF